VNNMVLFCSTAFLAIRALYQTQNFASVQREIQKLQDLYNTFDGIPKPYFEKINAQVYLVSEHGPAYVQPIVNIVNGVYGGVMMFGMHEDATPPEKTWASWITNLQQNTPAALMTLNLLETEANAQYDFYCMTRGTFEKCTGKKSEMGAFVSRDDRQKRRREESRSPGGRTSDYDGKRKRDEGREDRGPRERGRERERGRTPPRHHSRSPGRSRGPEITLDAQGNAQPELRSKWGEKIVCFNCQRNHYKSICPYPIREIRRERDSGEGGSSSRHNARVAARPPSPRNRANERSRSRSRGREGQEEPRAPPIEWKSGRQPIHRHGSALHARINVDTRISSRLSPPRHAPVQEFHWGLVNSLVFDHNLAVGAARATYHTRAGAIVSNAHSAMLALQNLPQCGEDEMWSVVDCGATHHYHPTRDFMYRVQDINILINGLTGPGPQATAFGLFLGLLEAFNKKDVPQDKFFSSVSYHVPKSELPLFSEVQACFAGCKVERDGHPETGHHGLYLAGPDRELFVPYTFEKTSLLWWIRIKKAPEAICLRASAALNPNDAPCQKFLRANNACMQNAVHGDPTGILKHA
jgi:hypothetical protein